MWDARATTVNNVTLHMYIYLCMSTFVSYCKDPPSSHLLHCSGSVRGGIWGRIWGISVFTCYEYTLTSVISTPGNVLHSLISPDPRERMFVVQISLLVVTFISLTSRNLSLTQTIKEVNPHPRIAPCVNIWSVTTNDQGDFWA